MEGFLEYRRGGVQLLLLYVLIFVLKKLLQVGLCLNAWGEGFSLAEYTEIVEA